MARFRPLRWIAGLLFNHWGTKTTALLLAALFFFVTREDVTRQFAIPLHVVDDPQRVLRTKLPETVTVEVHGSWSRINRLSASDLGKLELDLKKVKEGALQIDESTLVMPNGVILRSLIYDGVDVRFDRIIEREFPVKPVIPVTVHEDYEYVGLTTSPARISLRGPKTVIQEISSLGTEPEELKNITHNMEIVKSVLRPREGVEFAGMEPGERPEVTIKIMVKPKAGTREVVVPICELPALVPKTMALPKTFPVSIRGPRPDLRRVDGVKDPVSAACRIEPGEESSDRGTLIVDFALNTSVPEDIAGTLSLYPARRRFPITSGEEPSERVAPKGGGRGADPAEDEPRPG
ncbi:MAG: YbbR-like domain-containing protein [Myxococcales bacterium]|nr:YbbR-like domain-containing protein [Myxococcales bacterium]MCB9752729.1 YbbR-like domain-containing protein [Myxococcales bacterium]